MIRPITRDEMEAFCELAENPNRLHERLTRMFEGKMSSPDYCHVALEDGKFIAGAVYISFPSSPSDFGLWDIFKLTGSGTLAASVSFLQQSFRLLTPFNAERLEAQVSSLDDDAAERRALLVACGFQILQVKAQYEFDPGKTSIEAETGLHIEPFEKIGKNQFVNLIADATRGTLDRSQKAEYLRLGGKPWAENFFDLLLAIDPNLSCWRAAIVDGQAVGFVIPQMISPDRGAINYIGVIPAHRGHGISRDLLKVGTAELIRAGACRIIADIDVENYPLAKTLAAVGYKKTSELDCYQIEISSSSVHPPLSS